MQLEARHRLMMRVLAEGESLGATFGDLATSLATFDPLQISNMFRELQKAGYAEERFEGDPWPGESQSPDVRPIIPRRRFRLTLQGKTALNH